MVCARWPAASVSSSSTSSASRPLAPWTVSSCTASAAAIDGARTPPALQRAHQAHRASRSARRRARAMRPAGRAGWPARLRAARPARQRRTSRARRRRGRSRSAHRAAAAQRAIAAIAADAAPMPAQRLGPARGACSNSNQLGAAARAGAAPAAPAHRRRRSNSGDFSARASDRSWSGETSASSSATMSCTSGASFSSFFSGCWTAMCSLRSSSCSTASRLRRRASTMIWLRRQRRPRCARRSSARPARHSFCSRRSSGSTRGVVRLSRHGSAPSSSSRRGVVRGVDRIARDRRQLAHLPRHARLGRVLAEAARTRRPAAHRRIAALTSPTTACALRCVWSQFSRSPPRPCCDELLAPR